MHLPAAFRSEDLALLDHLLERNALATLVTLDGAGRPAATPVPVMLHRGDMGLCVRGHLARANPQVGHAGEALLLLDGPSGYVSPSWYTDKDEHARVPTWNYATAQLRGPIRWLPEASDTATIVGDLSAHHEAKVGGDWRFDPDHPAEFRQLAGIVGFEIIVCSAQIKLKLSQNHPAANIDAVIARLQDSGQAASIELAEWMQRHRPTLTGAP